LRSSCGSLGTRARDKLFKAGERKFRSLPGFAEKLRGCLKTTEKCTFVIATLTGVAISLSSLRLLRSPRRPRNDERESRQSRLWRHANFWTASYIVIIGIDFRDDCYPKGAE